MIRRTAALFCTAALGAALATGCANPSADVPGEPAGTAPSLAGKTFVLDGASGSAVPTLTFSGDGNISGTAGCNRLLGSVTLDGKKIDFSKLGMTRMMCSPEEMKVEETFTSGLARTVFATEDNGVLTLWDAEVKPVMTLTLKP